MNCETLQLSLSLYPDGSLSSEDKAVVDSHLVTCPICRQKLDDFELLRSSLRRISRPAVPADLTSTVRSAMRTELYRSRNSRFGFVPEGFREFLKMRVMPYAVGSAASVVIGFTMLWMLLSGTAGPARDVASTQDSTTPVFLPPVTSSVGDVITPTAFAAERIAVSGESPSINPEGALIALTKSLTRGSMKDSEVVVVADVFSDGLAIVDEVVEPLDDSRTLIELEKALRQDASNAPFVPASLDRRADSVRVVLRIQRVDVSTKKPKTKK
ncbi:MAG: zf-HC2 domain-containing protein [Acidobacteria bacterium]|nr:zf-HC2 domain-containing protein [Acidobacteriota bacterium]